LRRHEKNWRGCHIIQKERFLQVQQIMESWGQGDDGTKRPNKEKFYKEKAKYAFARPWFYYSDSSGGSDTDMWEDARFVCNHVQRMRDRVFGELTVEEVFRDAQEDILKALFLKVFIDWSKVREYCSIEDILAARQIIGLTGDAEIDVFRKEYVDVSISGDMRQDSSNKSSRSEQISFVLGASGSGKTFFSLHLACFQQLPGNETEKRVTLYLQPNKVYDKSFSFGPNPDMESIGKLVAWISNKLSDKAKVSVDRVLEMHVSVVIDEAGSPSFNGVFDEPRYVNDLYNALRPLAKSILLIITGTGVTGLLHSSKYQCNKHRMYDWKQSDLLAVLNNWNSKDTKRDKMISEQVVDALLLHPTLKALSTNARSASFLLEAIVNSATGITLPTSESVWISFLSNYAPSLVTRVVDCYVKRNALKDLTTDASRRRVAASVLHAVHVAKTSEPPTLPDYYGLYNEREIACASALIETNVEKTELSSWFADPSKPSAVLISPALLIVTCSMLSVPVQVLSGFKAQELVTVLYAFGKLVVEIVETYKQAVQETEDFLSASQQEARKELDRALADVQLWPLQKAVPLPNSRTKNISIPTGGAKGGSTVFLNGPRSPYADVIAPYVLSQLKHNEDRTECEFFSWAELGKCGILKCQKCMVPEHYGRIALQGFFAIWDGSFFQMNEGVKMPAERKFTVTQVEDNLSAAYPYNLLDSPRAKEEMSYLQYSTDTGKWTFNDCVVNLLGKAKKITYVISTNAASVQMMGPINGNIKGSSWSSFRITENDLNANGTVNQMRLSDEKVQRQGMSPQDQYFFFRFSE
jgi:hypothetical protein